MKPLRNQSGQMVVEYVLIVTIMIGTTMLVSTAFRENEILRSVITKPWQSLAGMIQNGAWGEPSDTMTLHPNNHAMHASMRGSDP